MIKNSELILNPDGSIYHLKLTPDQIATTIITVGDMERVDSVTTHFDTIEHSVTNREFKTVTGYLRGKRLSVISTGIGTDNIDIVFNELDALVNIDFNTRLVKSTHTQLTFIRIGTSGTLQPDIAIDSLLISAYAVDMGNLSTYYKHDASSKEQELANTFSKISGLQRTCIQGDESLIEHFLQQPIFLSGITLTAPGFYAPQGRSLRLQTTLPDLSKLNQLTFDGHRITNLEMETAGIYLLSKLLGHNAISCNALLANRVTGDFSSQPQKTIHKLISACLDLIA